MSTVSLGKVAITSRGEYDQSAVYFGQDVVTLDGSAYILTVDTASGQVPGVSTVWEIFAAGVPSTSNAPEGTILYVDNNGNFAPLSALPPDPGNILTVDNNGVPQWAPPTNRPALRVKELETTRGQTNQHARAIMENGDVRAWGSGASLQLGLGNTTANRAVPSTVAFPANTPPIVNVRADSAGGSFAIDASGDLWVWGTNTTDGNLGLGDLINRPVPVCVTQFDDPLNSLFNKQVKKVALKATGEGRFSTHVLCTDGTVHAAGYNGFGQIGDGTTVSTSFFKLVTLLSDVVDLQCGRERFTSVFAINESGEVFSWGYGVDQMLGHGNNINLTIPTKIAAFNNINIVKMAIAGTFAGFIDDQGNYYTVGVNTTFGNLGLNDLITRNIPELALTDVKEAFCFGSATFVRNMVIRTDDTLWVAGSNVNSALGVDNTVTHYPTFTQTLKSEDGGLTTSFLTDIVDVECNGHSVVVRDVYNHCWAVGNAASGSLGIGLLDATVAFYRPVLIHRRAVIDHSMGGTPGSSISMFLLDDGQLYISGIGTVSFNTDPLLTTFAVPAPVVL